MDQVPDISKFSEEEQRILRDVMSRAQDEEEKDRKDFRSVLLTTPTISYETLYLRNTSLNIYKHKHIPITMDLLNGSSFLSLLAMAAPDSGQTLNWCLIKSPFLILVPSDGDGDGKNSHVFFKIFIMGMGL